MAIECKFLEPMKITVPEFSKSYSKISDKRSCSKWFQLMRDIENGLIRFEYLDVAQLIKRFFGICFDEQFKLQKKTFLYVFYDSENDNFVSSSHYQKHLDELRVFKNYIDGDAQLSFEYLSFQNLWNDWKSYKHPNTPKNIKSLVNKLREKYTI